MIQTSMGKTKSFKAMFNVDTKYQCLSAHASQHASDLQSGPHILSRTGHLTANDVHWVS